MLLNDGLVSRIGNNTFQEENSIFVKNGKIRKYTISVSETEKGEKKYTP